MTNSLSNEKNYKSRSQNSNKASSMSPNTGKHILAEFWHCECTPELLTSTQPLMSLLTDAVEKAGLTLVGQAVHGFGQYVEANDTGKNYNKITHQDASSDVAPNQLQEQISGITLTLLLAESHLCLHTWGEYQTVTLDIYVCNVANDNSAKADRLFESCLAIFKPKQHHVNSVSRQHHIPNN